MTLRLFLSDIFKVNEDKSRNGKELNSSLHLCSERTSFLEHTVYYLILECYKIKIHVLFWLLRTSAAVSCTQGCAAGKQNEHCAFKWKVEMFLWQGENREWLATTSLYEMDPWTTRLWLEASILSWTQCFLSSNRRVKWEMWYFFQMGRWVYFWRWAVLSHCPSLRFPP